MKKLILVLAIIALASCSKSFESLKVGMNKDKVTSIVGEPEEKLNMFGKIDVWKYKENVVFFESDTITRVSNKQDIEEMTNDLNEGLEEVKETIEENY